MTKEEEDYYNNYFDLFLQQGWKQFVEELKDSIDTYSIHELSNEKELYLAQGQLTILKRMAFFEEGIRNAYDMLTEVDDAPEV